MTAVALIVEYQTPDLLALCLASVKRFAPGIRAVVIAGEEGAGSHAAGIQRARASGLHEDAEIVILLDTDVVIWSERWWWWVEKHLSRNMEGLEAVGGLRHRGDVRQLYQNGRLTLHASCLAMTRDLFERVRSFSAAGPYLDTAWRVTEQAKEGHTLALVPKFDGRVAVYSEGPNLQLAPLWAHLGRGTSFRPRGPVREGLRRVAAACGSPRARKILSYQQDRAAFLKKGWEIVGG